MGIDIQNITSDSKMGDLLKTLEDITKIPVDEETELEEEELEKFWCRFKLIYSRDFRHSYSNISKFLEQCFPDILSSIPSFLQRLVEYSSFKHHQPEDEIAVKGLKKLSDHIELECIRLDRMAVVKEVAKDIQIECKQIEEQSEDVERQAKEFHSQSIAILSIFSAVTLTFLGGLSFSSKIVESMASTSMFRLVFTILLLGFVLFNAIYIMLRFVIFAVRYRADSKKFDSKIVLLNGIIIGLLAIWIALYAFGIGNSIEMWAA